MKASHLPRKTANLSESIHQQLSMYALAASAAGVSMLALSQPADAKIVYTPADVRVDNRKVFFDLNHDGIQDFSIWDSSGSFATWLIATATGSNAIEGVKCYGGAYSWSSRVAQGCQDWPQTAV
jgi:hypothetical protein